MSRLPVHITTIAMACVAIGALLDLAIAPTPGDARGWRAFLPKTSVSKTPPLPSATVQITHRSSGKTTTCQKRASRFICQKKSWAYVGPKPDMRVAGKAASCTWAHPLQDHTTTITYPDVTLADGELLTLRTALDDRAVKGDLASVDITIESGGRSIATQTHPDTRGWRKEMLAGPLTGPLTLSISTKNAGRRHFCFEWEAAP